MGSPSEPMDLVIPLPFVDLEFECLLGDDPVNTDRGSLTILQVGNFDPRKNLAFTESIAKELAKDGYLVTLNLVGANMWHVENWLHNPQLQNFPNLHINTFLNLTDGQLELLWLQADLVFYFSYAEGFGLPVTEAVFRRIPTLANKDLPVMALCKSPHLWGVDINDFRSTYSTIINSIQHKDCTGIKPRLEGKFQLKKAWQKWAETTSQELRTLQLSRMSVERNGEYEN
jgi:alpha-1,2-rhamnosyltransferase